MNRFAYHLGRSAAIVVHAVATAARSLSGGGSDSESRPRDSAPVNKSISRKRSRDDATGGAGQLGDGSADRSKR